MAKEIIRKLKHCKNQLNMFCFPELPLQYSANPRFDIGIPSSGLRPEVRLDELDVGRPYIAVRVFGVILLVRS